MNEIMAGVYVGVVARNQPDETGRIEITLEGLSGHARSYPARIATLMAGEGYGTVWLPENNDQVLVAFINGSINEPIVIGGLWGARAHMPEANAGGSNTIKLIKTRSGNEIRIIDEDGSERIEIRSQNGNILIAASEITLDGNAHITGTLDVGPDAGPKTHIDKNEITGQ